MGSTDRNRRTLVALPGTFAESLANLISQSAVGLLIDLTGTAWAYEIAVAVDDTSICFTVGAGLLSMRRATGNFPNFAAVLSTGQGTEGWPPTLDRGGSFVH
jgi:hypothetical protein